MLTFKPILAILLVAIIYSQNCPTSYLQDDLQTGSKTISNFGQGSYSATTIVLLNPAKTIQIAASLSQIFSYRPDIDGGFQFSVGPKPGNIRRIAIFELAISAGNSWKDAKINYMISGREDFSIGNFQVNFNKAPTAPNFLTTEHINAKLPDKKFNAVVFLSGIEYSGVKLDLQITSSAFDPKTSSLEIQYATKAFPNLKKIEFMYIIYPVVNPILNIVYSTTPTLGGSYEISGLVELLDDNSIVEGQWKVVNRYLPCEGDICTSDCVRLEECQAIKGQILDQVCKACQLDKDGKCIPKKSDNSYSGECPERSNLNLITYKCECQYSDEYLINGQCQTCKENEVFNGTECICGADFYRINGKCRKCDPKSTYNSMEENCICNLGYFGNADLCEACHPTCSQCSGTGANDCTKCVDISYVFKNGYCTKEGPCNPGQFLGSQGVCVECSQYCTECQNLDTCDKCSVGFKLLSDTFQSQTFSYCEQICGDGRRFNSQCDDGNTKDGDGCSSECKVEAGFYCLKGSSKLRSECKQKQVGKQVILESKGLVNGFSKISHSISADYLPDCVIENQCLECYRVLNVRVVESLVPIQIVVNYIPSSRFQFDVEYLFKTPVTSIFTVSFKLNDEFSCLSPSDLQKVYTVTVDPTTLICDDQQLGDLVDPTAPIVSSDSKCEKQAAFYIDIDNSA